MGFFHSFFGKRVSKIYDPEELRRSLFELAQSGNQQLVLGAMGGAASVHAVIQFRQDNGT